jgi:hypothetical protein
MASGVVRAPGGRGAEGVSGDRGSPLSASACPQPPALSWTDRTSSATRRPDPPNGLMPPSPGRRPAAASARRAAGVVPAKARTSRARWDWSERQALARRGSLGQPPAQPDGGGTPQRFEWDPLVTEFAGRHPQHRAGPAGTAAEADRGGMRRKGEAPRTRLGSAHDEAAVVDPQHVHAAVGRQAVGSVPGLPDPQRPRAGQVLDQVDRRSPAHEPGDRHPGVRSRCRLATGRPRTVPATRRHR